MSLHNAIGSWLGVRKPKKEGAAHLLYRSGLSCVAPTRRYARGDRCYGLPARLRAVSCHAKSRYWSSPHQLSVTLLRPLGESGSKPLKRERSWASICAGKTWIMGESSSGQETGT